MDATTSALDTAAAVRARTVSPLEVLEAALARIDERNPAVNAVIWRDDDAARAAAQVLGDRIARGELVGPLAGVPVPIKELAAVAGQPQTHGSWGTPDGPAAETDPPVAALVAADAILCGRTNSPEFGSVSLAENDRFGITRNPWDPSRTPGGSSGGAAAAVAAGMFPVAHASDGGGSIRIPASCCGLVGHKPSRNLVPDLVPLWSGLSTEGAVTRTVADAAAVLDAMSAPDPGAWWPQARKVRPFLDEVGADPGRLRIAINTTSALGLEVAPEALAAVEGTADLLASLGHDVVRIDQDVFDPSGLGDFLTLLNGSMCGYPGMDWDRVEPHNRAARQAALGTTSAEFNEALMALQVLSRALVARFGTEFDVLCTPTMAIEPPEVGLLAQVHAEPEVPLLEVISMAAFTAVFNISGQPAVSLPLHVAASGLPVGVQLVAGLYRDDLLFRVAAQLEAAAPWADRYPFPA